MLTTCLDGWVALEEFKLGVMRIITFAALYALQMDYYAAKMGQRLKKTNFNACSQTFERGLEPEIDCYSMF